MPRFVTALFDDPNRISPATDALKALGVKGPDIQTIDQKRQAEGFFDRLFLDENGEEAKKPEDVSVMGISRADADDYAERVAAGEVLLIAMCDEGQEEEARDVLRRFGGTELGELPPEEESESALEEYPTDVPKWFTVAEVDETDPDKDVREHAIHIHTAPNIHHARAVDFPGGHPSARFEEHETDFRVHYAENFADSKYSFEDFRLAYMYGMAMAQNPRLKVHQWSEIDDSARRGWRDHSEKPWSIFADAVHFGWRTIRARDRREARR